MLFSPRTIKVNKQTKYNRTMNNNESNEDEDIDWATTMLPPLPPSLLFFGLERAGFSSDLLDKATVEPLTTNAHHKGVTPEDFFKSGLDQIFR